MLYFRYANGGGLISVTTEHHRNGINRNDFISLKMAEQVAKDATEFTGRLHIATDAGGHCSPRYDVIEAPKVGDEVSRGFNGDYYPAGKIAKVSASLKRVETDTGAVFFRKRQTGSWVEGGTWSMVSGHRSELNPSF